LVHFMSMNPSHGSDLIVQILLHPDGPHGLESTVLMSTINEILKQHCLRGYRLRAPGIGNRESGIGNRGNLKRYAHVSY
jgi:hypothetical protein